MLVSFALVVGFLAVGTDIDAATSSRARSTKVHRSRSPRRSRASRSARTTRRIPVPPPTSVAARAGTTAPPATPTTAAPPAATPHPPTTVRSRELPTISGPPPSVPAGTAPWLTPVTQLTVSPESARWASNMWKSDPTGTAWAPQFKLSTDGSDFSTPVYDARTANRSYRVYKKGSFPGAFNVPIGTTIPWNNTWLPSDGTDGFAVTINPDTGEEWDFWSVAWPGYAKQWNHSLDCLNSWDNLLAGFDLNASMCAASAIQVRQPDGKVADTRTYTGNSPTAGGAGIQNGAGNITSAMVASGHIDRAFKVAIPNTMFGPLCSPSERETSAFGTTCGSAVAPAGQFERVTDTSGQAFPGAPLQSRSNSVPEGMRFSLRLTDAEIDAWLNSRGYTGVTRSTARTIAIGLRDYGWMVTDTDGQGVLIQFDGSNPQAWRSLGVPGTGKDMLTGLFSADRIVAYTPATNVCADGTLSHWYCWASASRPN